MWTRLWRAWTAVVTRVGAFQARVVLALLYFVVIPPFALVAKRGADPLRAGRVSRSNWTGRPEEPTGIEAARRQS